MLGELKTAALIVNPFASAVSEDGLAAVERELRRSLELSVSVTEHGGHATELARELDGVEAVFVYGGDGLLNEVLNGLGPKPAVGVVPGGGKNVVARSLDIPLEPVEAVGALVAAPTRRISLGRAKGRRSASAAGVGFAAELARRVDARGRSTDGRRPGALVFSWEAAKLLSGRRGRYEPVLQIDGLGRAAFALVANAHPYTYA